MSAPHNDVRRHRPRCAVRTPASRPDGRLPSRLEPLEPRRLMAAAVVDDAVGGEFGVPTVIQPGTLLGNDTDIGSIPAFTQPANGTVTRDPTTGALTYTPRPGFSGTDSFTYTGRAFTAAAGATLYIGEGDLNGDSEGLGVGGGEVTVDSFAVSVANPDGRFVGVPGGPARADTFDFTVGQGAASPGLLAAVASGRTVDRLTLVQRGPTAGSPERLRWTLTDARFLQYAQTDGPATAGAARERFSVSFDTATLGVTSAGAAPTSSAGVNLATAPPNRFPLTTTTAATRAGLFLEATGPETGDGFSLAAGATPISDFAFDVTNTTSTVGGPAGRSDFGGVTVKLPADDGSAPLLASAALGRRWGQVALIRRALVGGQVREVERYVLTNARVTSYAQAGAGADQPADTATLTYESIQVTVVPRSGNGTLGTPAVTTYSRLTNATTGPAGFGGQTVADRPSSLVLDLGGGQLAVDDYAWEVSRTVPPVTPGPDGRDASGPALDDFTFRARPGPATAGLLAAAADQRTLGEVTLSRRDATGPAGREVTRWTLTGVRVSAFGLGVDAAGNPVMTFALSAVKVVQRADFLDLAGESSPVMASYDRSTATGDGSGFGLNELDKNAQGLKLNLGGAADKADLLVSSAEWGGLANALLPGTTTPAGRPAVGAVTITAATTQNSPGLFAAVTGITEAIDTVTLTLTRPGATRANVDLLTYTLTNVLVGRYAVADDPAGGGSVETFTLHFDKVEVAAVVVNPTTGVPGETKRAAYDAKALTNAVTGAGAFPRAPLTTAQQAAAGSRLQATGPSAPLAAAEAGAADVRSFAFAIDNDKAGAKEGFLPVTVTLNSGVASAAFLRAAATGAKWNQIVLTAGSGGPNPFVRTRLTLGNARVISVRTNIDGAGNGTLVDTITLSYDTAVLAVTTAAGTAPLVTNVNVRANTTSGNSAVPTRALPTAAGFVLDLPADVGVTSFAWSAENTETAPGTGGRPGRVRLADFTLTAPAGSASAGLLLRAFDGKSLGTGIEFRGRALAGGGFASLFALDNVFVVAYSTTVDAQGVATDTFRLEAVAVAETASAPGGAALNTARWDSANNTGTAPPNFGRQVLPGPAQTFAGTVRIRVPGAANRPPTGLVINPQVEDPDDGAIVSQVVDLSDGAAVGNLNATDPDAGDVLTFSLTGTADGRFALVGNQVRVADGGRIAGNARYTITARVTDRVGASADRDFVIDVPAVDLRGNVLVINGTDGNDRISFAQAPGANSPVFATINGLTIGGATGLPVALVVVNGGAGDDLVGAAQLQVPTVLRGGAGNDSLFGGSAADTLVGGDGIDDLGGNAGDDQLSGGRGNDGLDGGAGNDLLDGGDDDDVLQGGVGADRMLGGAGNDRARFPDPDDTIDLGPGQLDGVEFRGTSGNDTIVIDVRVFRLPEAPYPRLTDAQFRAAADADLVPAGRIAVATINGRTVAAPYRNGETIFVLAGDGDDAVSITEAAGRRWRLDARGGAGNDTLTGGAKDDLLFGDAGDDALAGGGGNDFLDGGAGRDTLCGGAGADHLLGAGGRDALFGGDGDDFLNARDAAIDAVIDGGAGRDRARKDSGEAARAVEVVLP